MNKEKLLKAVKFLIAGSQPWECESSITVEEFELNGRKLQLKIILQSDKDEFEEVWNPDE